MKSSRVHISLITRMIEAKYAYQLLSGVESNHNKYNGLITFAQFTSNTEGEYDKLPIPCTTKVSMYVNHPVYTIFIDKFNSIFPLIVKEVEIEVEFVFGGEFGVNFVFEGEFDLSLYILYIIYI